MGNFYKDKDRVMSKIIKPRIRAGCTRSDLYRAVRLSPFGFGQRIVDQLIDDLIADEVVTEEGDVLTWRVSSVLKAVEERVKEKEVHHG